MRINYFFHFIALTLLLVTMGNKAISQVMISATGKPESLVICHEDGTFSLLIANTTGTTITGATLLIDLPSGCIYTPGSITGASQLNISNLNQPTFTLPEILNNTAHTVTYDAGLICGYNNTMNFNYTVNFNNTNYSGFDTPLQNYYFPVLVISNITNASASVPVGQTITREITIEQQGLNSSMDTLILLDSHTADIQILSTSVGTLHSYVGPGPTIVDTIIITGSDVPGSNGLFDYGESIAITETVRLVGCDNGQSTLKASWGCNDQYCNFYSAFPSVSPASGSTSINMSFTGSRKDWGFIDNSGWVEFTVTNNGSGYGTAFNLVVFSGFSSGGSTYYPNGTWLNKIDSFSVAGNYLPSSYNYAPGAVNGRYSYYTTLQYTYDPDGPGVGLEDADNDGFFDDLPVGKSFTMKAHTYYDWQAAGNTIPTHSSCGYGWTNNAWQAFRYGYKYIDQCFDSYDVQWIPNGNLVIFQTYNTTTTQHIIPPDIYDGQIVWMEQTVSTSTSVSSQGCPGDSVVYKVIMVPGVTIAPGTATFKNVSMGTPLLTGDTAIYYLERNRVLSGGTFRVPIMVLCEQNPPPLASVSTGLFFWCDKTLYPDRYFSYWCSSSPIFGIQCPVGNCTDPYISSFAIKRTTMGWTDGSCSLRITPTAPGLRLDNALARDTLRIEVSGRLNETIDSLYFRLQHNGLPGNWGNQLFFTVLTDTLFFYDQETDQSDTCINLSPQVTTGTTSYLTTYLGGLNSIGNCLQGTTFSDGDKIKYVIIAQIRNVARNDWETVPALRARFYWKDQGSEAFCNDLGATFNILGSNYPFTTSTWYQQIILQGCNSFQYEGLIYRSLDPCGGDIAFPGEIRPYCVLDSMTFILPEGFIYESGSSRHSYQKDISGLQTDIIPDPLIDVSSSGTRLIYARDSTWGYADHYDCNNNRDRLTFNASPSCKVTGDYSYQFYARGRYQFYADGNGITGNGSYEKAITYTNPSVELTAITPTAEGREDTVTWEVRLCNSQPFNAENNWLGFEHPAEGITVIRVIDITNSGNPVNYLVTSYAPGKTWVQLGNLGGLGCRRFLVKAVYSICDFDSLLVRHCSNCASYPVNPDLGYPPSGFICSENNTSLYLDPKDVSLNLAITSPVNPVFLCDTLLYEAVVTNTQLSFAFDLKITVVVPPGLSVVPGTSLFKYPYSTGSFGTLGDPVNFPAGSNKWVFDISGDTNCIPYLLGVDSLPKNGFRLQFKIVTNCDFTSGRSIQLIASASNACGEIKHRSSFTQQVLITGIPTNVNLYVISTNAGAGFQTCSNDFPVHVKVINLGPSSISSIEKLKITIDDAFNYVNGSLTNIHNGPSGLSNSVIAGNRYLDFAIEPNLSINDSIVFAFQVEDIDPGSLVCDTIPLETNTLLVAKVFCETAPNDSCLIHSITSTQVQFKPIFKDHVIFGKYLATSIPDGSNGENVTIHYAVINAGTDSIHFPSLDVLFVHDANNNGIADDIGADSLLVQTIATNGMAPGDSILITVNWTVPADKVCRMLASIRLCDNECTCGDIVLTINQVHLMNAGPDVEVCMQTNAQLGMTGINGYAYYWVPTLFLNSPTFSDPVFNYNTILSQPDTINYILNTTRPGGCVTRDTTRVIILPSPIAFAGEDTVACTGYPHLLADATALNSSIVLWTTSGTGTFNDPSMVNAIYYPSADDYTAGTVSLNLFANGLCGDDTDNMTLTFNDPASSYAGPDTTICNTSTYTVTSALVTNTTGFQWISTGDGTFNDTGILGPIYTPGPSDVTAGAVSLILQSIGLTSCPVVNDTMTLLLISQPELTNTPAEKTICSDGFTDILLTSNAEGTTFSWTGSLTSGNVSGFSDGNGTIINQQLFNPDLMPGAITYSIIPVMGGCTGGTYPFLVTVNPLPAIINENHDTSFCSGGVTFISLISSIPGTSFSWTATSTASVTSGFFSDSGPVITQLLVNQGNITDTVIYTVTPEANGCSGPDSLFFVTVFPVPDAVADPTSQEVCSGDTTHISLSSPVSGSSFSWSAFSFSSSVTGYTNGVGDTILDILLQSGENIDTVIYSIMAVSNGCSGPVLTVPVTVNPIPAMNEPVIPDPLCSGDTLFWLLQSPIANCTFSWNAFSSENLSGFYDGTGDTIRQFIFNTGFITDTVFYMISPSANGCSGETVMVYALVNPIPDVVITPPVDTICSADTCVLNLTSHVTGTGYTWVASTNSAFLSGFSGGTGNLIAQQLINAAFNPGTVTYSVTPLANGCYGTSVQSIVTVDPSPVVTIPVCFDTVTTIQARPIRLRGGIPLGGTYNGNSVSGGFFDPVSAGPGFHPIWYSYTNRFSCTRSDTLTLAVFDDPPFACGDTILDIRDGTAYPTVLIGSQCWLAANLNYGSQVMHFTMHRENCIPEKYCYLNQQSNCITSGGLYQWDEMMEYSEEPGVKGLCPPGWHVPGESEWNILFNNYVNSGFAGNPLKTTGYSEFNALLNGIRFNNMIWKFGPEEPTINSTLIWSSTLHSPDKAWAHGLINLLANPEYTPSVSFYPSARINAFPVRCLKD